MNPNIKKTSIITATVASFVLFAGAVSAQEGPGNGGFGPGGRGGAGRPPIERPFGQGQGPFSDSERPDRPRVEILQSIVEASGLTAEELRQQLQDGATIEEILAAAGTSLDAVIDQAVTDGVLTEEQAAALKERIAEGDFPNPAGPIGGPGRDHYPVRAILRGTLEAAVDLTGLEAAEIRQQLQDGATLKEILEANGSSVDALVDVVMAEATERLNAQVEEGKITAERAAELLAELETRLTTRLNEGRPVDSEEPAGA